MVSPGGPKRDVFLLVTLPRGRIFKTMVKRMWLPIALLIIFTLTRLPGLLPPNFSPVYAVAFCAGAFFPARLAWWIPAALILGSDCALDWYYWHDLGYSPFAGSAVAGMLANYLAYAGIILLGRTFQRSASWAGLVGGSVLGAILFYIVTNIVSWLTLPEYAKSLAGLIQALTTGLPNWPHTWEFFRNTLTSAGLFAGLFAAAVKIQHAAESPREKGEEESASQEEPEPASEESPA